MKTTQSHLEKRCPVETRMSSTEALKGDGRIEAVSNHDNTIPAEGAPAPVNTQIMKEPKVTVNNPKSYKRQIDHMKSEQTCVTFKRINHAKPNTDELVHMHSELGGKTTEMELKWTRYFTRNIAKKIIKST